MHKWYSRAVVSTMTLVAACASPSQIPIVDTEAAPKTIIAAKTNQITPPLPEPVAIAPMPIDEPQRNVEPPASERPPLGPHSADSIDGNDELVNGGVWGGVVGGFVSGVSGDTLGVPAKVSGIGSASASDLPDGVFRMGDSRLTQTRCPQPGAPPYPQAAKDANVETRIVVRCIVETNGTLNSCKLLKSHPLFDKPMLEHLKKAKVPPMTTTDGKPARVQCQYVYRFNMQ